jgi:hypothetical protein
VTCCSPDLLTSLFPIRVIKPRNPNEAHAQTRGHAFASDSVSHTSMHPNNLEGCIMPSIWRPGFWMAYTYHTRPKLRRYRSSVRRRLVAFSEPRAESCDRAGRGDFVRAGSPRTISGYGYEIDGAGTGTPGRVSESRYTVHFKIWPLVVIAPHTPATATCMVIAPYRESLLKLSNLQEHFPLRPPVGYFSYVYFVSPGYRVPGAFTSLALHGITREGKGPGSISCIFI